MKKLTFGMRITAIAVLALPSCTIKAENLIPVGRYQITANNSGVFRCDTITGELTRYVNGKWLTMPHRK